MTDTLKAMSRAILLIMVVLCTADSASAHKVTVFAWVEGDMVYTQSKFSGGKKVRHAIIRVLDDQGNQLLEGKTDANGEYAFKAPQKTGMKIILLAGMGHRAEWVITAEEFSGGVAEPDRESMKQEFIPLKAAQNDMNSPDRITLEDIQHAVDKSLDNKLSPIVKKLNRLSDSDHKPGISDILGGIGYIIGLVGIGAYVHYRNKSRDDSKP